MTLFKITSIDAQHIAQKKLGRKLTIDELYDVKKSLEYGLEYWYEAMEAAVDELKFAAELKEKLSLISKKHNQQLS